MQETKRMAEEASRMGQELRNEPRELVRSSSKLPWVALRQQAAP